GGRLVGRRPAEPRAPLRARRVCAHDAPGPRRRHHDAAEDPVLRLAHRLPGGLAPRMTPRTPEDCDALIARCVNGGGLGGLVALYEPAATLVQQDGSRAAGHDAIRQAHAPLVGAKGTIRMDVT